MCQSHYDLLPQIHKPTLIFLLAMVHPLASDYWHQFCLSNLDGLGLRSGSPKPDQDESSGLGQLSFISPIALFLKHPLPTNGC